jgi:NTE family protein
METKALVLSGGSIKGAFQAGAIKAVIDKGFFPDFMYGISVGSLNSTFINNEAGKQRVPFDKLDWNKIKGNLIDFWLQNINKPADLVKKRSFFGLFLAMVQGKFNGLVDTIPLRNLIHKVVDMENILQSPLKHQVGAVNITEGEIIYADSKTTPDFLDYVLASTAMPIIMPGVLVGNNPSKVFFDGGIRNVAPLKNSIKNGATSIVCILCQPEKVGVENFNYKSFPKLTERMTDIMVNQIETTDLDYAGMINKLVPEDGTPALVGPLAGKRKIKITVIRPKELINIDVRSFTKEDISAMINLGYQTAQEVLKDADI